MSTTTTETITLQSLHPDTEPQTSNITLSSFSPPISNFDPASDAIIAESRLADSQVPDGGYGWVIISACSILTFFCIGSPYSWGVIQAALVKEKLSTPAILSFVGSLSAAIISFLALVNARIIRKIGARSSCFVGVVCFASGMFLGGFCTENIGALFFTVGGLVGIGGRLVFSYSFSSCVLMVLMLSGITACNSWLVKDDEILLEEILIHNIGRLYYHSPIFQQETWTCKWNRLCRRRNRRSISKLHYGCFTSETWPSMDIQDYWHNYFGYLSSSSVFH